MKLSPLISLTFASVILFSCGHKKVQLAAMKYPETLKTDSVDTYFGEHVADPYRWLEDDTSKQTGGWVEEQNKLTFAYLNNIPYRDKIKKRMEEVFNYERLSAPFKEGGYYYYFKNDGLQNQSVLYRKK